MRLAVGILSTLTVGFACAEGRAALPSEPTPPNVSSAITHVREPATQVLDDSTIVDLADDAPLSGRCWESLGPGVCIPEDFYAGPRFLYTYGGSIVLEGFAQRSALNLNGKASYAPDGKAYTVLTVSATSCVRPDCRVHSNLLRSGNPPVRAFISLDGRRVIDLTFSEAIPIRRTYTFLVTAKIESTVSIVLDSYGESQSLQVSKSSVGLSTHRPLLYSNTRIRFPTPSSGVAEIGGKITNVVANSTAVVPTYIDSGEFLNDDAPTTLTQPGMQSIRIPIVFNVPLRPAEAGYKSAEVCQVELRVRSIDYGPVRCGVSTNAAVLDFIVPEGSPSELRILSLIAEVPGDRTWIRDIVMTPAVETSPLIVDGQPLEIPPRPADVE